jgi:hypothetical protein
MTPISSQYDIWAESYDQNIEGRPDSQLQPPFQNSAILPIIGPRPDGLRYISFPRS